MEAAQKDLSVLQCSYEDEETLTVALGIFKPHIEVDAIRPDVDVALPREVSLCPLPVLRLPDSLQADDVCGGEAGGVGTEECFQCGHHVAGGDTLQVEDGQESVDGGDTAQVAGEDGTGEGLSLPFVPDAGLVDPQRTNAGDEHSLRQPSVSHHHPVSLVVLLLPEPLKILGHFLFDGCLEEASRPFPDQLLQK